jgi:hypothetical protein
LERVFAELRRKADHETRERREIQSGTAFGNLIRHELVRRSESRISGDASSRAVKSGVEPPHSTMETDVRGELTTLFEML